MFLKFHSAFLLLSTYDIKPVVQSEIEIQE